MHFTHFRNMSAWLPQQLKSWIQNPISVSFRIWPNQLFTISKESNEIHGSRTRMDPSCTCGLTEMHKVAHPCIKSSPLFSHNLVKMNKAEILNIEVLQMIHIHVRLTCLN